MSIKLTVIKSGRLLPLSSLIINPLAPALTGDYYSSYRNVMRTAKCNK